PDAAAGDLPAARDRPGRRGHPRAAARRPRHGHRRHGLRPHHPTGAGPVSLRAGVRWRERGLAVDLDLPAGRHAITGPNGAGKSSLLSVIAGLTRPDSAHIALSGRDLTGVPPHQRRVALLSQAPTLFPHLDARDNVAFGPRSRGRRRREARATAEHWLGVVGMGDFADRRPSQLSGGQAARVALARALAAEPDALLLDEPLA